MVKHLVTFYFKHDTMDCTKLSVRIPWNNYNEFRIKLEDLIVEFREKYHLEIVN